MCNCELHDSSTALAHCTCICEKHDHFFESSVVVLRKTVRELNHSVHGLHQDMGQAMTAIKENAEDHNKRMAGIENLLSRITRADPDFVRGIAASLDRIIDRVDSLEERLSPPEEAASEYPALPDPLWDRYGVKWTPVRVNGELRWDAVIDGEHERWSRKDLEDSRRGPFTSKSPLAEDQEPLSDAGEAKDVEPGLWSEPWEPQFSDEDTDVLSIAIRQAVGAAYYYANTKGRIDNRLGPGHSESDRKSCMSCHTSPVDCDRSRTYNSEACCQFCEVETFKVAHPVKKTTKSEETSDGREHETDADSYMPLGTDPTLWAKEFLRVFHHGRVGTIPDEGTLIGWFANAIAAGRSAEYQTYVANADRIRLAKDALVSSGYFTESDLTDDEIAPRIRELISAHNTGFFTMKGDLDRQITKWKDRALVAERRMSSVRQFVQDNLAAPVNPEKE